MYYLNYTCTVAGAYNIIAQIGGIDISGKTFVTTVQPGMLQRPSISVNTSLRRMQTGAVSALKSTVTASQTSFAAGALGSFTIQAADQFSNNEQSPNLNPFVVNLNVGPSNVAATTCGGDPTISQLVQTRVAFACRKLNDQQLCARSGLQLQHWWTIRRKLDFSVSQFRAAILGAIPPADCQQLRVARPVSIHHHRTRLIVFRPS